MIAKSGTANLHHFVSPYRRPTVWLALFAPEAKLLHNDLGGMSIGAYPEELWFGAIDLSIPTWNLRLRIVSKAPALLRENHPFLQKRICHSDCFQLEGQ